jgi:uncharacterized protein YbjT (DUF2867 family)
MTTIGILGGTGPHGRGLARCLAQAGHEVVIGSRQAERAQAVAASRGIYAGRLRDAGQVEALAANLIAVNRRYRVLAGTKITDLR